MDVASIISVLVLLGLIWTAAFFSIFHPSMDRLARRRVINHHYFWFFTRLSH